MLNTDRPSQERRALARALVLSLAVHGFFLALVPKPAENEAAGPPPLQARLAPPAGQAEPPTPAPPVPGTPQKRAKTRRDIIHLDRPARPDAPRVPTWTPQEKNEMDNFLNDLAAEAKRRPPPLAQRSLAAAREIGRELARQDEAGDALLELRPNAPPADPFSLDLYLDGLIRRLNRSAGFGTAVRHRGLQTAAVQFRINPDGTLKSFVVLNAADQAEEIAFIKATIERALPFSPFPPDIDRAARSLGVTICIQPGRNGDPGFTRMHGGRCV